jgi:hypothetical protein
MTAKTTTKPMVATFDTKLRAILRERVVKALGGAERAKRELTEAHNEMRALCETLGIQHPAASKIATSYRDTTQAVALLSELLERLPR